MLSLGERIKDARKRKNWSQQKLADHFKISREAVQQWETGKTAPPHARVIEIAKVLEAPWVMAGNSPEHARRELLPSVKLEELDVSVSAGPGLIPSDDISVVGEWEIPRQVIQVATSTPADRIKIVSVKGDSMEPKFFPHDRVMVDTDDRRPSPAGYFVVWDGFAQVVKRVEAVPHTDPPRVRISSVNRDYEPYERTLDEAYIQGRVLGKWLWT